MKTVRQFEAQDIDTKDPIHRFLFGELLIAAISRAPRRQALGPLDSGQRMTLSRAEEKGISITVAELPAVYR